ncbi:MAG: beta-lactamase family protein, partial [Burkholderiales bacterium]
MNRRITDRIDDARRRYRLPGLAVAVRQDDRERFAAGFGHIDPDASRPVSADTPFGVASLSKFVTATLIMRLQERGRLLLDDPLSRFYPSLDFASDGSVRLHHLLSHSAGLPGLPCRYLARDIEDTDDRSGGSGRTGLAEAVRRRALVPSNGIVSAAELADLINRLEFMPLALPGELLSYSNEGYCLLGGIIEQVARCSFAHAVRDQVFGPLNLNRSFVGNEGLPTSDELGLPLLREG